MKKFLMLITAMLCIFCGALAFASCGESTNTGNTGNGGTQTEQPGGQTPGGVQEKPHVHSFTDYVYNDDATCLQDGTETGACSCGETDTRTKRGTALGHSFEVYTSNEDATCTENGTETATCIRCSEQDTREVKDSALGHSFDVYISNEDATCTENGTETATCIRCSEQDTREVKDSALGHSFEVYTSNEDATCTENGTETATCIRCSEQDTREVKDSALGHDWDSGVVTPATCTTPGQTYYTCNHNPDHHKTEEIKIDPSAHEYGEWIPQIDAECEKDGVLGHFECEYCHENFDEQHAHLDSLKIDQLGHDWDSGVVTPATCTTPGQTYYTCNHNPEHHKTEKIEINPSAHEYGKWIPQIDAECEKDGVLGHFECEYCHENFDEQHAHLDSLKIDQLGHDWDSGVVTPATCTTPGQTYYTCNHNPEHHKTEEIKIDPSAHEYGEWIPQIDAKCTEEGKLGHFECEYCHHNFDIDHEPLDNLTINKLDHQYGAWQDEIPTSCTAPGRRGYQECESCHLKYDREGVLIEEDDLTIAQLAHNYQLKYMKHRTCISQAAFGYTCNKCGGTYEEEIPDIDLSVEMTSISLISTVQKSYHINLTGGYGNMQLKIQVQVINSPNVSLSGSGLDFKISHSGSWNSTDECILTITCSDEYGNITTAKFSLAAGKSVPVGLSRLEQTVQLAHSWQPKGEGTPYTHTLQCKYCEEETAEAHTSEDGGRTCSVCGKTVDHSLGLSYSLNGDGTAYTVTGMGSSTDTELVIPEQYGVADGELLPVTAIAGSAFEW